MAYPLSILTIPSEKLQRMSQPVDVARIVEPDFQLFLNDLIHTMQIEDGIGIAAPQVDRQQRIIVINLRQDGPTVFINPEITRASEAMMESEEGCLSVPGKFGTVQRHKRVSLKAYTRHGRQTTLSCSGLFACVFQHEIDHLNGRLFIDHATNIHDYSRTAASERW